MSNENDYLTIEEYEKAYNILEKFTILVLFEFGKKSVENKDKIIRNFISRGIVSLREILRLWRTNDYHDCWVIHRCLVERFFLLEGLGKNNSFETFEKWSYKKRYEARNRVKSDAIFKDRIDKDFYEDTKEQKERYEDILKENIKWTRPRAEDIAKEMGMDFLYKYAYDYGSTYVHPMADDGSEDYVILLDLDKIEQDKTVLNNSFLITKLLIQSGLNLSSFSWAAVAYNFLDNFLKFLEKNNGEWLRDLEKAATLQLNDKLTENKSNQV